MSKFSKYVSSLEKPDLVRYEKKLKISVDGLEVGLPDPYTLTSGWATDPTCLPPTTYACIYNYLIKAPGAFTGEKLEAYKSLESYNYFISGKLKGMKIHPISEHSTVSFVKAMVEPGQKVGEKAYKPWVCLDKNNGYVICCHCTCMAGLGEACSHIAAILFAIEATTQQGINANPACTSVRAVWNEYYKENVTPCTAENLDLSHPKHGVQPKRMRLPRPRPPPLSEQEQNRAMISLKAILPSAAVCCKSDSDTDTASETSGPEPDDLPLLLEHIVDAVGFKEGGNLKEAVQEVIKRSHVTREQILNLSHATVTQRNSSMWSSQRKGRITASNMYRLMSDRNNPNYDATVRAIMQYDTSDISFVPSVKWGIDNEENAIKGYCKHMSGIHVNFKYDRTGLVLCDKYSFLAASPDGLVSCNCHDSKVVEIKCPYSVRNDTEILEKIDYLSNGSLKRNHKYFSQVQTQMFVCNTKYCDFVVWTPDEMLIVDVDIDLVYCEDLFKKVQHFATNYLVPELLSNSLKCGNPRASANDNKVYCLCKRPKFGKMIACDGDNCECEWFHYGCVGLLRKPRRKWYCNECLSKE